MVDDDRRNAGFLQVPEKKLFKPQMKWRVSPEELAEARSGFPQQDFVGENVVGVELDGEPYGVSVWAMPPADISESFFWAGIEAQMGETDPLRPTPLVIAPPIDLTEYITGEHTPASAMYPHVVLEDGARYGVGIHLPAGAFTRRSETKLRRAIRGNGNEKYHDTRGIGILVRLNGDTPVSESTDGFQRGENFLHIAPPKDNEGVGSLISSRKVRRPGSVKESDLTFEETGERGKESNADSVNEGGRIQVIFIEYNTGSRVEEFIPDPPPRYNWDSPHDATLDLYRGSGYSTLGGRTLFTGEREGVDRGASVYNGPVTPLAEVNIVLVGHGGLITSQMNSA